MDTQTRIGIGAAALFGMTAFVEPLLGWYVAGPAMGLCAIVAAWGFWPAAKAIDFPFPSHRIPFHTAAIKVYEAAEKGGVLGQYVGSNDTPEKAICSLKTLLMVHDGVDLFGKKPPSTKVNVIPKAALQGEDLTPVEATKDELFPILPLGADPTYVNVVVGARGLRRLIKEIRAEGRGR
jgi:hypothetical protein